METDWIEVCFLSFDMTKRKKMSSPGGPVDSQVSGLSEEIGSLKDYIKAELSNLREEFKGWSEARLAAVEQAVEFALDSVAAASARAGAAEAEARRAISGLEAVSERLRRLEDMCDNAEQNSRLDLLVFSGKVIPKSGPDENCAVIVRRLLEDHMGYRVNEEQINRAHRIQSGKIVVKFNRTGPGSDKDRIWKLKTRLRGKDLYVQESLTERRQEIFQALLQARRDGKIFSVYTQGGKVLYRLAYQDYPHRAPSMEAVANLVRAQRAGLGESQQRREQGSAWDGRRTEDGSSGREPAHGQDGRAGRSRPAWAERERAPAVPSDAEMLGSPLSEAGAPVIRPAMPRAGSPAAELTAGPSEIRAPPRTDDVTSGGGGTVTVSAAGITDGTGGCSGVSAGDVTHGARGAATLTGASDKAGGADGSAGAECDAPAASDLSASACPLARESGAGADGAAAGGDVAAVSGVTSRAVPLPAAGTSGAGADGSAARGDVPVSGADRPASVAGVAAETGGAALGRPGGTDGL